MGVPACCAQVYGWEKIVGDRSIDAEGPAGPDAPRDLSASRITGVYFTSRNSGYPGPTAPRGTAPRLATPASGQTPPFPSRASRENLRVSVALRGPLLQRGEGQTPLQDPCLKVATDSGYHLPPGLWRDRSRPRAGPVAPRVFTTPTRANLPRPKIPHDRARALPALGPVTPRLAATHDQKLGGPSRESLPRWRAK